MTSDTFSFIVKAAGCLKKKKKGKKVILFSGEKKNQFNSHSATLPVFTVFSEKEMTRIWPNEAQFTHKSSLQCDTPECWPCTNDSMRLFAVCTATKWKSTPSREGTRGDRRHARHLPTCSHCLPPDIKLERHKINKSCLLICGNRHEKAGGCRSDGKYPWGAGWLLPNATLVSEDTSVQINQPVVRLACFIFASFTKSMASQTQQTA